MEFLIMIFVFISVVNAISKKGQDMEEKNNSAEAWKSKQSKKSRNFQMPSSTHDVERVMHEFKSRAKERARQLEETRYQKEELERKKKEAEARRRRDMNEQRKESAELLKKQAELKERLKKEQARKAQEEKDKKASKRAADQEAFVRQETIDPSFVQKKDVGEEKEPKNRKKNQKEESNFHISDYLDPLTASFYPGNQKEKKEGDFNVDDYLFPTIASFYPQVDEISFSLQNPPDMI